ncbi:GTP-binding protein [Aquabacterium sp. OR-4]|uniref:GTP-binding protein n=1 Tax=Aquabacterium sp. OR-4 TaxID=2978127 RepID=UPI0021B3E653|nr:ATP/GTP-binding protein [Aquabacterium sp. OR-4]MDT7837709.1 ATP/GTP-binding protein [Aquabacterium sp. OR-4]
MSQIHKIVFVGPVGAGKTQAIRTLSDIEVVSTEARASDEVQQLKPQTTVAMDYGVLHLDNGDRVRLYGTPGQERFDFMWDILTEHALGLVMLVRATAPDPLNDLRLCVSAFRRVIDDTALVVGLTHSDSLAERGLRPAVMAELARLGVPALVMNADARERSDMVMLVKTLIYSLDPLYAPE